jgi:hypothetical protein
MINPYCDALSGFFSEMVYYGLLKKEDAQCFRTEVKVKPTFYILFTAAICLALTNSFIMKAVIQYFRDSDSTSLREPNPKVENIDDFKFEDGTSIDSSEKEKIHPVPVLFTDRYRWFLYREDTMWASRQSSNSECCAEISQQGSVKDTVEDVEADTLARTFPVDREMDFYSQGILPHDDTSLYTNS